MAETQIVNGITYRLTFSGWTWFEDRIRHAYTSTSVSESHILDALSSVTAERDALLAERDRMRAAGDALYESMDCSACRISSDFTFCAQCVADREQWRNLAPIISRTAEGSP